MSVVKPIVNCPDCTNTLMPISTFGRFTEKQSWYKTHYDAFLRAKQGDIWQCGCCDAYYHTFIGKLHNPQGGWIDEKDGVKAFMDMLP